VKEHIRPRRGDRILDIGCGPGDILAHLPDVDYEGFDANEEYIAAAQRRFGARGHFRAQLLTADTVHESARFDVVLALGLLHHLDDREAKALHQLARDALRPGGRLITLDPCLIPEQSAIARWVVLADRGRSVRSPAGYADLARPFFADVKTTVCHDLVRIPTTGVILECTRAGAH
jgi:SAM-dependent methyltransferase